MKKKTLIIVVAAVLVIAAVLGIVLLGGKKDDDTKQTKKTTTTAATTTTKPTTTKPTTTPTTTTTTPTTTPTTTTTSSTLPPEPDPVVVHDITIWVSTTEGIQDFTAAQIEAFKALHPEYNFNITIERVSEGDAGSEVLKDIATAPDMYCFAQNQVSLLAAAGALALLDEETANIVALSNDVGSVNAATVNGNLYAYPMTSDNGYYLYYDSSYISDEEAKSIEGIIAACERSGKKFGYSFSNAWYMAGFFFAQPVGTGVPLCTSTWTYSDDGRTVIGVNDTFYSENGLIAMKAIHNLAQSGVWIDQADNFQGTAAIVTGIWNATQAEWVYGDHMKATKLPTFTVDGETYQMGSFSGCKLLGVKPQDDSEKAQICRDLALFLTSEESQLDRYYEFQWGPSNVAAQNNQDVKENKLLAALIEQNQYAQPQGVIPNDWWTEAAALGTLTSEAVKTEEELRAALADYESKIQAMLVK